MNYHNLEDENLHLKGIFDSLEEEKEDAEGKLNQSVSEIERSILEHSLIAEENIKIKHSVLEVYECNQVILTENSQIKEATFHLEAENEILKAENEQLIHRWTALSKDHATTTLERTILDEENMRLRKENENLIQTVQTKEDYMTTFLREYNNKHYLQQQHDSIYESSNPRIFTEFNYSHELNGLSFQFDK